MTILDALLIGTAALMLIGGIISMIAKAISDRPQKKD